MILGVTWGPILFETLVPGALLIMAGLLHVVWRLGNLNQEVKLLRHDLDRMWDVQSGVITYRKEKTPLDVHYVGKE